MDINIILNAIVLSITAAMLVRSIIKKLRYGHMPKCKPYEGGYQPIVPKNTIFCHPPKYETESDRPDPIIPPKPVGPPNIRYTR